MGTNLPPIDARRLPSPREAAGRGRGWVEPAYTTGIVCPPPRTPPHYSLREWGKGSGEAVLKTENNRGGHRDRSYDASLWAAPSAARRRSSKRCNLPVCVFGNSARNSIARGYL